jgi:hypothetical protein
MRVSTRSTMHRSTILSLGKLLPGIAAVASAAACSAPAGPTLDPARAFVETPSGRHVSLALASSAGALEALAPELAVPSAPFVIAKFAGPVTPAARRALAAAGYRAVSHLPYDAMLLERPRDAKAVAVAGMVALAAYLPEDRLSRDLLPEAIALRTSRNNVPVMIHVMPGHQRDAVRAVATAKGGSIAGEGDAGAFGRVTAIFPVDAVAEGARALAELPEVFVVERIHHVGWLNDKTAGTIQSGVQGHDVAQTPIWAHGIHGEGQIVGMADTGLDANSCYFNGDALPVTNTWSMADGFGTKTSPSHRKIVAYDFLYSCDQWQTSNCENPDDHTKWDTYGHGTHVAGNMVGDSDNNPETFAAQDGMAPGAKIVVQDAGFAANDCSDGPGFGCPIMKLDPLFEQARLQGASVHNNSWGDNEDVLPPLQCNYTARSQDVDRYIWEHKEFLIVYAAGNEGARNVDFSVGSPSTNKNGLSIGSTRTTPTGTSDENISSFSSRGWTSDGRIKPDLMVPGNNTAARNDGTVDGTINCAVQGGGGTSYAAPIAVGAAALVRQYFTDGFYPSGAKTIAHALTPTAALIKAAMINSAASMIGNDNAGMPISPIPSNEQGWGRVKLDQTLLFTGSTRKLYIDDHRTGIAAGDTTPITYTINGVDSTAPLKITLVWTDYPSTPDSAPTGATIDAPASWNAARLVNDLDLTVTGPGGTYLGNSFADGASALGGTADRRNNVEQVLLVGPTNGSYTVTVQPNAIVEGPQDFAVVVTGAWGNIDGVWPPPAVGDASVPEDGSGSDGSAGAGTGGSAGAGTGGGAGAGTGGSAGAGTGGSAGDANTSSASCSCVIARQTPMSATAFLALAAAPLAMLRRHRRFRRRSGGGRA